MRSVGVRSGPVPPLALPSELASRAARFAPLTQEEIARMRSSGDDGQPKKDANAADSSQQSSSTEEETADGASQPRDANTGPSDDGIGVIAGILLDGDGNDVFDDEDEDEAPSSPKRPRRKPTPEEFLRKRALQTSPPVSEEDEDEQLVESSAPVTKQPRTAAVEGDADEHHVGHAMAPPPTSDSTDTDVPMGQVAMTPSKHTSIGGSTSAVAASTPSRVNPINDDTPMVRRLDGTCEALPSKVDNPNFAPRRAHPGGKMATNDKDEVQVKFNLRKNVPIEEWPERLKRKKAEMDAADGDDGQPADASGEADAGAAASPAKKKAKRSKKCGDGRKMAKQKSAGSRSEG